MELVMWAITIVLGLFFPPFAAFNWSVVVDALKVAGSKKEGAEAADNPRSMAPLLGGIMGCLAMGWCPLEWVRDYRIVPLFLDVGCAPYALTVVAVGIPMLAAETWRHGPWKRVVEFSSVAEPRGVTCVRLCRKGRLLVWGRHRQVDAPGHRTKYSVSGTWTLEGESLVLRIADYEAVFQKRSGRPESSPTRDDWIWKYSSQQGCLDRLTLRYTCGERLSGGGQAA
ncbi:MAG: hypothetical protein AB1646_22140 [Thermodesulfobacteriota bacterium]